MAPTGTDAGIPAPAGFREFDGSTRFPGLTPQLLESGVKTVFAISPDERRAVVSHQALTTCSCNPHSGPQCTDADNVEISIVTIGAPTVALPTRARLVGFSPDSRFITLSGFTAACGVPRAQLVRADGTDLQPDPGFQFEPGWIYSSNQTGLFRRRDLGDAPEQVAGPRGGEFSPDGDALFTCAPPRDCSLQSPVGAAPVPVPGAAFWSADGRYVFAYPCTLYDRTGLAYTLCDPAALAPSTFVRVTGDKAVFVTEDSGGFTIHVRNFVTGDETLFSPFASTPEADLTPDGARVIAEVAPHPMDPASPGAFFVAPSSGGAWARLVDGIDGWAVSSDSRVLAMGSVAGNRLFVSVDGGPAQRISVPGLALGSRPPTFEPAGGTGKALFGEFSGDHRINTVIGNEDGSGDWLRLPGAFCERWAGHTALCAGADGLVLVRGDDVGIVGDQGIAWVFPSATRKLFFTTPTGLYVVDNPGP